MSGSVACSRVLQLGKILLVVICKLYYTKISLPFCIYSHFATLQRSAQPLQNPALVQPVLLSAVKPAEAELPLQRRHDELLCEATNFGGSVAAPLDARAHMT